MIKKHINNISDTNNQYQTITEAMNDFMKFKTAQGMSELTLRDYTKCIC